MTHEEAAATCIRMKYVLRVCQAAGKISNPVLSSIFNNSTCVLLEGTRAVISSNK